MNRMVLSLVTLCWIIPAASGAPQGDRHGVSVIEVKTHAEAEELRDRVRAGDSFGLSAIKSSVGRSWADGGYIGNVRASDLRSELRTPLERMKPGEVSPVIRVGSEYLLLRWSTAEEDRWRSEYSAGLQALQQGRYPAAVRSFLAAITDAAEFGPEDHRVARSMRALSQVYRLQANYAGAKLVAQQSLKIFERLVGADHPAVIPSLQNLAAIGQESGDFGQAEQLYRKILAIRWGAPSGAVRVDAGEVLEELAAVLLAGYSKDAKFDDVFGKFEEMLSQAELRSDLYAAISDALLNAALPAEAEAIMRRAVLEFPNSREVRSKQADTFVRAQRFEKALDAFEAAAALPGPEDSGVDKQQLSLIYQNIGKMNVLLVRFDAALAAYDTSLQMDPKTWSRRSREPICFCAAACSMRLWPGTSVSLRPTRKAPPPTTALLKRRRNGAGFETRPLLPKGPSNSIPATAVHVTSTASR